MPKRNPKLCPECNRAFNGKGWEGIDAHWRANHEDVMPYEKARIDILLGCYKRKRPGREDFNQAAFRAVQETIRRSES